MIDILTNRRSVRKFKTTPIEDEKLAILKKSLLLAPTSRNLEPCEFIMVRDKAMLKLLSEAKAKGAAFLAGCDTAFVVCGDTEKSDVCIEDCSIASITLQYTAETVGLKSCWAQMRLRAQDDGASAEETIKSLLGLPESYTVVSVIGVGYPDEPKEPKADSVLKYEKIHEEKF